MNKNAVPYFRKQGFRKKISQTFDRRLGQIKDYDCSILIKCILDWKVDCINVPLMLKAQKIELAEELKEKSGRDRNLPSSRALIMLFLLFQDILMEAITPWTCRTERVKSQRI